MDAYTTRSLALLRSGRPVLIMDTETTGLLPDERNPHRPRPSAWEVGAVRRTRRPDGTVARTEGRVVVDTGPLPADLVAWNREHGIDIAADTPVREGRPPREALPLVARSVAGCVLVGHNLTAFDAPLLAGDMRAAGVPVPAELADPAHHVDTMLLARALWPKGSPGAPAGYSLGVLAAYAGYRQAGTFHRALDDCRATEALLLFCVREAMRREGRRAA